MTLLFSHALYFFAGFFVALTLVADLQRGRNSILLGVVAACTLLGAIVIGAL